MCYVARWLTTCSHSLQVKVQSSVVAYFLWKKKYAWVKSSIQKCDTESTSQLLLNPLH